MNNFCCNDDFDGNGKFDAVDKDIFNVFITECLTNSNGCPESVNDLLNVWDKAVANNQVAELTSNIDHLPSFDCADFNLNGQFDAFDRDIYDVFITECLTSSSGCPQTIQSLLDVYPKAVANRQVAELQGEIKHLPRLNEINCTPTPTPTPSTNEELIKVKLFNTSSTKGDSILEYTSGEVMKKSTRAMFLLSETDSCYNANVNFVDGTTSELTLNPIGKFNTIHGEQFYYSLPWKFWTSMKITTCVEVTPTSAFGDSVDFNPGDQFYSPTPSDTPVGVGTPAKSCNDYANSILITDEIAKNEKVLSFRGISISGFETDGYICMDELSENIESKVCHVTTQDLSISGVVTLAQKPSNSIIIYMSKYGDIYQGEIIDDLDTGLVLLEKQ